jgi:hypothetical protein
MSNNFPFEEQKGPEKPLFEVVPILTNITPDIDWFKDYDQTQEKFTLKRDNLIKLQVNIASPSSEDDLRDLIV